MRKSKALSTEIYLITKLLVRRVGIMLANQLFIPPELQNAFFAVYSMYIVCKKKTSQKFKGPLSIRVEVPLNCTSLGQ